MIVMDDVEVPAENMLPNVKGLKVGRILMLQRASLQRVIYLVGTIQLS